MATQCEVAEALRPKTVEASLLMVEDLLGHALAHIPAVRECLAQELKRTPNAEANGA